MDSLLNGSVSDSIPIRDRGLAYGDGVFETMAARNGEPLLFTAHMERLQSGCRRLGIAAPDTKQCRDEIERLCSGRTGVVKLILTRGCGGRGYAPEGGLQPNRLLLFSEWRAFPESFYRDGVRIEICRLRISEQPQLAGMKHLNRIENVLAAQELDGGPAEEGLMLDHNDYIIECTRSNIFFIKEGRLHTPDLGRCGVNGVMRNHILECARRDGIQTLVRDIHLDEAEQMEEAFVCNSLIGIWPVARLGNKISFQIDMIPAIREWTREHTLGQGI
ncbi:MAG TPA: aminodeoxychorismate lyase [Gammaproteobacteria bacterium]|nr:aminodeoxychorismate lyase [Gammaproteobacteria bacterium]